MKKTTKYSIPILLLALFAAWKQSQPSIFLIGDSISMQYGPYLEKYLEGTVAFDRKKDDGQAEKNLDVPVGANGGDSRMVLEYLKIKTKEPAFKPDYLVLNCGLHDIKHDVKTGKIQVGEAEYRKNLQGIIDLLKPKKIKMIWIRTTAVVDSIHNSKSKSIVRYGKDLAAYNQVADQVMAKNNIPRIDLYDFTWKLGIDQFIDHVHYNEQTRSLQAAYLAGSIQILVRKP
ncbi:SGNH/GDSL hydrolase family protein [Dyadobacter sp. CY323]|uniref:SGNH/GDSL hydrolase family protein n=1 Tax=Dyadobacter sp. CY323 TaxID=2907302 RepID=UPI001F1E3EFA|nr:SGNH/GDSL hydrolase family protein [Dyadobacter sp. CY323]MCE6991206.1 SGNH/GDSL hydrolase family protein [Dyadobacter sp. CY323]